MIKRNVCIGKCSSLDFERENNESVDRSQSSLCHIFIHCSHKF